MERASTSMLMVRVASAHLNLTHEGDLYEGQYQRNKKHGKGMFLQADGTKYEGFVFFSMLP